MSEKILKPVSLAVGLALAGSLAGASVAQADSSPFAVTALSSGYMTTQHLGEGSCGGAKEEESKGKEGKCGEGKCGGEKGEKGEQGEKGEEGKCGGDKGEEGKCGGDKGEEGKCGGAA